MANSTTSAAPATPTTSLSSIKPVTTPTPTLVTIPVGSSTTVIAVPTVTPSTLSVIPTPTPTPSTPSSSTSVVLSTVTVPVSASNAPPSIVTVGGTTNSPIVVIQTITTSNSIIPAQSSTSAAALATESANLNNGTSIGSSSGLSGAGKTAVEVIVPIAATAFIALAVLFLWRKRRQSKAAQEARRKEMEEYGYNPNNDPNLPAVGAMAVGGPISHDTPYDVPEGDNGYRGWGATTAYGAASSGRKPSTTLSGGGIGKAYSDGTSNHAVTSDARSGETLIGSPNGRPQSTGDDTLGAMGGIGTTGLTVRNADVHRGPSNASSSYSAANISEVSGDNSGYSGGYGAGQYYSNDGHYGGPYGDANYSGQGGRAEMPAQPVIRDNQARRAPRIENPSHFPTQGTVGIAQNF